jgi:integrase
MRAGCRGASTELNIWYEAPVARDEAADRSTTTTPRRTSAHRLLVGLVVAPPKTRAGLRSIALDHTTVAALRDHRSRQQAELTTKGVDGGGFVFTTLRGEPMSPDTLTRTFNTLVAASGLPPVRLHDWRHGAGSLALQAGVDLKVVQDQLGMPASC